MRAEARSQREHGMIGERVNSNKYRETGTAITGQEMDDKERGENEKQREKSASQSETYAFN